MTRERRTQAERRATSEERILTASAELIVAQGISGTSLSDIGRRAECSPTLVNHLFGSKGALVERLNEMTVAYFTERAAHLQEGRTGLEALVASSRLYLELVNAPDPIGRVHVVMWAEAMTHAADLRPARERWDRYFRDAMRHLILDGVGDGSIRPTVSPDDAALVVVGMFRGVALQLVLDPTTTSLSRAQDAVVEFLTATLAP